MLEKDVSNNLRRRVALYYNESYYTFSFRKVAETVFDTILLTFFYLCKYA